MAGETTPSSAALPVLLPEESPLETVEVKTVEADLLAEFFEIVIHSVLYHRELYPPGFFTRKKKYDVPIWVACHPAIKEYVDNCILTIKPMLAVQKIETVMLTILEAKHKTAVERFAFRIISKGEALADNDIKSSDERTDNGEYFFRMGESLRAFLLRIAACKSYLKPLPPDCACVLQIVTDAESQLIMAEEETCKRFPWIEADDRQRNVYEGRTQSIRGPTSGICPIDYYVEESSNKFVVRLKGKAGTFNVPPGGK